MGSVKCVIADSDLCRVSIYRWAALHEEGGGYSEEVLVHGGTEGGRSQLSLCGLNTY